MTWTLSAFADEAGDSTDEQIAALQQAGFKYIDPRNVDGHNIAALPLDAAQTAKKKLDAAGITVKMFGSPLGKIDIADDMQSEFDKIDHLGEMKKVFGCDAVRMFSYYNKAEKPMSEWATASIDRLKQLRDRAATHGLVLYHENERHIYGDRLEQVIHIADELHSESFKLIFDFDNYNQSGDDVWENWLALRDHTDAIHLKDSTAPPDAMHVPAGQGNGQIARILADAKDRGWNGPLTLEPHLTRSKAVMATGPSGQQNQALADMTSAESFRVAADAAKKVLAEVGATYE